MLHFLRDALLTRARQKQLQRCGPNPLHTLLATPLIKSDTPINELEFLALDLEMTGLDASKDRILSIGTTVIKNLEIDHSQAMHNIVFQSKANLEITAPVHRIFDKDLADGVNLKHAIDTLLEQANDRVLVMHHASLDLSFINTALEQLYGAKLYCQTLDTLQIERRRIQHQGKEAHQLSLANTRERYKLPVYNAHNAAIDALATAELLLAQIRHKTSKTPLKLHEL